MKYIAKIVNFIVIEHETKDQYQDIDSLFALNPDADFTNRGEFDIAYLATPISLCDPAKRNIKKDEIPDLIDAEHLQRIISIKKSIVENGLVSDGDYVGIEIGKFSNNKPEVFTCILKRKEAKQFQAIELVYNKGLQKIVKFKTITFFNQVPVVLEISTLDTEGNDCNSLQVLFTIPANFLGFGDYGHILLGISQSENTTSFKSVADCFENTEKMIDEFKTDNIFVLYINGKGGMTDEDRNKILKNKNGFIKEMFSDNSFQNICTQFKKVIF